MGSFIPSSKILARQITRFIPERSQSNSKCHYLEVGSGTGVFTEEILRQMKESDVLDVVEIDPVFCKILKKKFKGHKNIQIFCSSITDWNPGYKYDAIISSLPLNSFSPVLVQKMIESFRYLLNPDGILSYYEYEGLSGIKLAALSGNEKIAFGKVLALKNDFYNECGICSEIVLWNFPPAKILHFKPDAQDAR